MVRRFGFWRHQFRNDVHRRMSPSRLHDCPKSPDEPNPKTNPDARTPRRPKRGTADTGSENRQPSACQRHITVTIPREEIDRYFDKAFAELMPTAAVPGFRAGRAPRKLVEHRFRKDVADKVKSSLLMDSLARLPTNTSCRPSANRTWTWRRSKCPTKGR